MHNVLFWREKCGQMHLVCHVKYCNQIPEYIPLSISSASTPHLHSPMQLEDEDVDQHPRNQPYADFLSNLDRPNLFEENEAEGPQQQWFSREGEQAWGAQDYVPEAHLCVHFTRCLLCPCVSNFFIIPLGSIPTIC